MAKIDGKKKLLIFSTWPCGDDMDLGTGSNLWYIQRYEEYFDEVTHLLLGGNLTEREQASGNCRYISAGGGNNKLDLLLAPFRLYRFAKSYHPTAFATDDQLWLFWVACLVKLFCRARIVLIPITYPEATYASTNRSLTKILPIWLERLFLAASYRTADRVTACRNSGNYPQWMSENRFIAPKLLVLDTIPEAIPPKSFFDRIEMAEREKPDFDDNNEFELVHVGRLHPEKSVEDVVRMMAVLRDRNVPARLSMIGDGEDKPHLEQIAHELGIADRIQFLGWRSNADLPNYLVRSDAFVSSVAGGALREAALCGLPIIMYERDWIVGMLKDRETFLAVPPGDIPAMAAAVEELITDRSLRQTLSSNIRELAFDIWSDKKMRKELERIYDNGR